MRVLFFVGASFLLVNCGSEQLTGESKRAGSKEGAASSSSRPKANSDAPNGTSDGPGGRKGADGIPVNSNGGIPELAGVPGLSGDSAEMTAIGKCMTSWSAIKPQKFTQVRKVYASVAVLSSGTAIKDEVATDGPALVLIYAGVNVLGDAKWELRNPNGWYCVVTNVNVLANLTVQIAREAKLTDSAVKVDVLNGSNTADTAGVGVNVGSNVKVERI
jgi:hypothetical protein